jgi:hypothetical protein
MGLTQRHEDAEAQSWEGCDGSFLVFTLRLCAFAPWR